MGTALTLNRFEIEVVPYTGQVKKSNPILEGHGSVDIKTKISANDLMVDIFKFYMKFICYESAAVLQSFEEFPGGASLCKLTKLQRDHHEQISPTVLPYTGLTSALFNTCYPLGWRNLSPGINNQFKRDSILSRDQRT